RVGLRSLALARPYGGTGAQRMQEPPDALCDLIDGRLERRDVRCRRLCKPTHLPDVLKGRCADLLPRGRGLEVVEDANVPAHGDIFARMRPRASLKSPCASTGRGGRALPPLPRASR